MNKGIAGGLTMAAAGILISCSVLFSGCDACPAKEWGQQEEKSQEPMISEADCMSYIKQANVFFEGGKAVIGFYDQEAAMEFTERQPLVVQLEHVPGKIVLKNVSDSVFERQSVITSGPAVGDIVMDVNKRYIAICCEPMTASPGLVPLGHVISGMENLERMEGIFDVFVTAHTK